MQFLMFSLFHGRILPYFLEYKAHLNIMLGFFLVFFSGNVEKYKPHQAKKPQNTTSWPQNPTFSEHKMLRHGNEMLLRGDKLIYFLTMSSDGLRRYLLN